MSIFRVRLFRRTPLSVFALVFIVIFALSLLYMISTPLEKSSQDGPANKDNIDYKTKHHLAIIIPFRDCWFELLQMVPHLHQFLKKQRIRHTIYVINQVDILRYLDY